MGEVEVEPMEDIMEDQVGAMVVEIEMETEEIQVEIRATDVTVAQVETATNNLAPTLTKVKQETEMEEEAVEEEEESVLEMFWRLVLMFVLDFQLVFSQPVWVDVPNDALAKNELEKKIFATIQNCTFPFRYEKVVSNVDLLRKILFVQSLSFITSLNMMNPNQECVYIVNQ